jgi:urocanate hydratase
MLNNNLDPEVAEDPENLVIYGGTGRAARSWDAYDDILTELRDMEADETLLVQSGKPVGRFRTHEWTPCVLIVNSTITSDYDSMSYFRQLERNGKMLNGMYTAGSWAYIGTQGIIQGTYEVLAELADQHFDSDLEGKLVATGGLGGMGGAQPLAVTMNRGVCLVAELDSDRIDRRIETGYCQERAEDIDVAIERAQSAVEAGEAYSVAVQMNAVDLLEALRDRAIIPDVVTDQTSAHDELDGYYPSGYTVEQAVELRETDPDHYLEVSLDTMERHVDAMLELQDEGAIVFDYGNDLRGQVAEHRDRDDAFDFPGFAVAYMRPKLCRGEGPFRWAALSGAASDIHRIDGEVKKLFPEKEQLHRWIDMAQERVAFQGLPARVCWLGYETDDDGLTERARLALRINELVDAGELSAPVVVTRDQLDAGSVTSATRATENMKDDTDGVADWPVLNALLNTASGADIVSFHGSGGKSLKSMSANNHVVLDGSDLAAEKAERVFTSDPGTGIVRHAEAGYEDALEQADLAGVHLPFRED